MVRRPPSRKQAVPAMLSWIVALIVLGGLLYVGYFAYATRRIAAQAEKAVPPAGRLVDVDGNRIHYIEAGQGRPILFVHGLGAQFHQFRHPLFPHLRGEFRLVALDRPGSGYSVRAHGAGAGIREQARVIVRFMAKLGLEKPLIVGHSLGGAVALAIAVEHPGKVSGLALLSPYTHHTGEVVPEFAMLDLRPAWWRWMISHTFAIPAALKAAPRVLELVFGPQAMPADYPVAGGGMSGLRPAHFYATSSDFVARGADMPQLQARYGEIKVPVGILFGTADRTLSCDENGVAMRDKIVGLDLQLLDGIGHMPQYAATGEVVAFVRRMAAKSFAA